MFRMGRSDMNDKPAYKVVWDFHAPAWGKKKRIHMKGEHSGGIYPFSKEHAESLAAELNRQYGEGTHRVEIDT